ncbi:hypothetical protein VNO77_14644 [Canavalia gladiata]|uniref:Uncharacterized protein n=1 Tax=Canavalia gladiata TaxID=3824 RepID=A0AAN9QVI3_CANGL
MTSVACDDVLVGGPAPKSKELHVKCQNHIVGDGNSDIGCIRRTMQERESSNACGGPLVLVHVLHKVVKTYMDGFGRCDLS